MGSGERRILVVTPDELPEATLGELADEFGDEARVTVVAPALNESVVAYWVSDADEAIARARQVEQQSSHGLRERGTPAQGAVGDSDPRQAVLDAIAKHAPEKLVVYSRSENAYREDQLRALADDDAIQIPVEHRPLADGD